MEICLCRLREPPYSGMGRIIAELGGFEYAGKCNFRSGKRRFGSGFGGKFGKNVKKTLFSAKYGRLAAKGRLKNAAGGVPRAAVFQTAYLVFSR